MSSVKPTPASGVLYQYYWIKVATEGELNDYRKWLMERKVPEPHPRPFNGGVIQPPEAQGKFDDPRLLGGGVIQGPQLAWVFMPDGGGVIQEERQLTMRLADPGKGAAILGRTAESPNNGGVIPAPVPPTGMGMSVDLGFIAPDYAQRKKGDKMTGDMRAMPFGWTRKQAEDWFKTEEAQGWASGAFCILAYIALATC